MMMNQYMPDGSNPIISLIVAVDEAQGMGYQNQLPWHLPADLSYFKQRTMGKSIIMGRKTFESIGKPLPGRKNIVLSKQAHDYGYATEILETVSSVEQAIQCGADQTELMVIGGAQIYALFLPLAQTVYLTRVHGVFEADVRFPQLDDGLWVKVSQERYKKDERNHYDLDFICYCRR